jgi:hypothetical protein
MTPLRSILQMLRSCLDGLDEAGVRQVPVAIPFRATTAPTPTRAAERPPAPVAAPAPPAATPPPRPQPVAPPAAPPPPPRPVRRILALRCIRLSECGDKVPSDATAILVLCDHDELMERNRVLLLEMLKAIGYGVDGDPQPLAQPPELAGKAARILCLGNPALLALDPHGMDLGIVRGMWQQTPWGRMIASYPPSYLHDNPPGKKAIWLDLQNLLKDLKLDLPPRTR